MGIRIVCTDPGAHVLSFYLDSIRCVQSFLQRGLSSETPPILTSAVCPSAGKRPAGLGAAAPWWPRGPLQARAGSTLHREAPGALQSLPRLSPSPEGHTACAGERERGPQLHAVRAEGPQSSRPPCPLGDCRNRRGSGALLENLEHGLRGPRPAASGPDCLAGDLGFAPSSQGENRVWVQSPPRSWARVAGAAHQKRRAPCRLPAVTSGQRLIQKRGGTVIPA